jgi:hypothetical protein
VKERQRSGVESWKMAEEMLTMKSEVVSDKKIL